MIRKMRKAKIFPRGGRFYSGNVLVKEKVESGRFLRFLYGNNLLGWFGRFIFIRGWFNKFCGFCTNSLLSRFRIKSFINKHSIDMKEFEVPICGYRTFNEFFTRRLKLGVRRIDSSSNVAISPCDGKVFVIENVGKGENFLLKGEAFNLEKLLGSVGLASSYEKGTLVIFRLAPYDYHHFHFPFDCLPSSARIVSGVYNSVNPVVYEAGLNPLLENERHSIILKSQRFFNVVMVLVGALCVGKIVETYEPGGDYKKGEEAGYFALGGSMVALLFKQEVFLIHEKILRHSYEGFETAIKMGEVIGSQMEG